MLEWDKISERILSDYPGLKTDIVKNRSAELRYFFLPQGFKDIGNAVSFGFLSCHSQDDFDGLMDQLSTIAKQLGATKLAGPINFSTFFDYRLKMNNFNLDSFPGEPKNGQNEVDFFVANGFSCFKKYFSHQFPARLNMKLYLSIVLIGLWAKIKTAGKYKTIELSKENYLNYLDVIYVITVSTFSKNFLFQKISFDLFRDYFVNVYLPHIDFKTSFLVLSKKGDLIGYSLCLQDPTQSRRLLFKTIGVLKSERSDGLVALGILRDVYLAAQRRYDLGLACLMIEGNKIDLIVRGLSQNTTEYGLFEKNVN